MTVRFFPRSRREFAPLSAILSVFARPSLQVFCTVLALLAAASAQSVPCGPSPEIRSQLENSPVVVTGPADLDRGLAPLLTLRQRYPNDLWVNEGYQDAVQLYGIEGHLRKLTEEYQVLSMQHPDDLMYGYLYARSLMGRNTLSSIQQMTEIIAKHPEYAPAHVSLAEIYASTAFRDETKEKTERDRLSALCPQSSRGRLVLGPQPSYLPEPSPLVDQAEILLAQDGDPERVAAMAEQGIRDDEWRMQRIRPFDWYSVDYKRHTQRELESKYWRVWAVQVHCHRAAGAEQKAAELLRTMEQRAVALRNTSSPIYWEALATLVRLYEEGNQRDLATQKLNAMQEFLTSRPDRRRAAELADLRKLAGAP